MPELAPRNPFFRSAKDKARASRGVLRFVVLWWAPAIAAPISGGLFGAAALTTSAYFDLPFARHVPWTGTLFLLGAVAALIGTFESYRRLLRWEHAAAGAAAWNSRAEQSELALVETICDELRGIIDTLSLFSTGRASLFICKQDHFVLAGRYSLMAQFSRSVGREKYPLGSGILGQAWNDGEAAASELPDPGPINRPPHQAWLHTQARYGIDEAVAKSFAMRSRSYAAIRLEHDRRRLGVIVIESTNPAANTAASKNGGAPGGSLEALNALDAGTTSVLSRALHHLRHLDDRQLRERVVKYLPEQ
ncbi:MAG: hypothetical protein ACYDHE_10175 [Candidatus Acidiferrales bacterium]